jgi:hypothetical protein
MRHIVLSFSTAAHALGVRVTPAQGALKAFSGRAH